MSNGKSAGDAHCPAEYFKALEKDGAMKGYLREVVGVYWKSGSFSRHDILAEPAMALAVKNGWRIVFQHRELSAGAGTGVTSDVPRLRQGLLVDAAERI